MDKTTHINDIVFVKALEQRLNRRLTIEELDSPLGVEAMTKSGDREFVFIPKVAFPMDLIPSYGRLSEPLFGAGLTTQEALDELLPEVGIDGLPADEESEDEDEEYDRLTRGTYGEESL